MGAAPPGRSRCGTPSPRASSSGASPCTTLDLGAAAARQGQPLARGPRPGARGAGQGRRQLAQGLPDPPRCWPGRATAHAGGERDGEPGPQPVEPLGDHVRALPRGGRDVRAGRLWTPSTRPAASGTCARCSAPPTSPAGPLLHLMTGNLSHQIEHHLFPDLPSNRYAEIAVEVRDALRALRAHLQRAARWSARSPRPGTASSGCRCRTAGWTRPVRAPCSRSCDAWPGWPAPAPTSCLASRCWSGSA